MNKFTKKFFAVLLMTSVLLSTILSSSAKNMDEKNWAQVNGDMTENQFSSLAMLNYMTVLSQEITASSNSRLFLDNAYSEIVNNINPNAVDEDTMEQIRILLNTIYAYQSIETKRDRLQYIYEQNQAHAIQQAIPNPMSVLNLVQSTNPVKALVSVIYMAVDSAESYSNYLTEVENKYLEEGWKLDDAAAENLHESRKEAFTYMVEMCQKYNLDGKLALNEKSVENFVSWNNNTNITRKTDFLEKNQETYQAYGQYWLVLAECYYKKGNYLKCLDAIGTYENLQINIFRKDHDLANALVFAMDAASQVYSNEEYIPFAEHCLETIEKNIESTEDDWLLRYTSAQAYMDLYSRNKNPEYLNKAYELAMENVNYLIDVQQQKNEEYLNPIKKEEVKGSKEKRAEIKKYNEWIEEERKTALPPVYQPLLVNCELMFGLAEQIHLSNSEKTKIEEMLRNEDGPLFLVSQLENTFTFDQKTIREEGIVFDGSKIEIPVSLLEQGASLRVVVSEKDKQTIYEDWILDKVNRKEEGNINTFIATYKCKEIGKYDWTNDSTITIEIVPPETSNYESVFCNYKAKIESVLYVFKTVKFEKV